MEAQRFQELADDVSKRSAHAQKLTIIYTIVALVGGSLWLTIAYYKARQYKKDAEVREQKLEQKSEELDQKVAALEKASANLAREENALKLERQNLAEAKEAIKNLGKLSPEAQKIAQKSLREIGARWISPSPKNGPVPISSPTPIVAPTPVSRFVFRVKPGDKVSLRIEPRDTQNSEPFIAVVKDGQSLSPPYSFVVNNKQGEKVIVIMEFVFLADAPETAKYKVAVTVNDSQLESFEVLKTSVSNERSLRFLVQ